MKKLSMFMAMVMCATLALSGCGNSVSDDRAQAYASLSSMTNLEQDQVKDYKQRLTVAPDSAAIKSVLDDAKATRWLAIPPKRIRGLKRLRPLCPGLS